MLENLYRGTGWRLCGLGLLVGVAIVGCGGPKEVTVTGTVLQGKQPVTLGPTGVLQVTLAPDVPEGADYTTYPGRCDATGKFEVPNVPPGRYKFAIQQFDPDPTTDALQGAFAIDKTKFVHEVDGKTPIAIELPPASP